MNDNIDWVHHDSKTLNENYFKVINGTALYYENYVNLLQQDIKDLQTRWDSLREWLEDNQDEFNIRAVLDKINELEKKYEKQDN